MFKTDAAVSELVNVGRLEIVRAIAAHAPIPRSSARMKMMLGFCAETSAARKVNAPKTNAELMSQAMDFIFMVERVVGSRFSWWPVSMMDASACQAIGGRRCPLDVSPASVLTGL